MWHFNWFRTAIFYPAFGWWILLSYRDFVSEWVSVCVWVSFDVCVCSMYAGVHKQFIHSFIHIAFAFAFSAWCVCVWMSSVYVNVASACVFVCVCIGCVSAVWIILFWQLTECEYWIYHLRTCFAFILYVSKNTLQALYSVWTITTTTINGNSNNSNNNKT